ncbi:MAG: glutathione S-transferase N-terminal domain-containing protein [Loktanella sp.]|jgi:GSH-dependent disulfide-bond oxidoreductase|nr:glutathione S-transferase N-terminal domain-containing protein [Loktanella sp.]MDO7621845.1 glutathione S-transferase N-terminal domain-containing protein [Loktanella sp.]MDO7627502.1 glutathione S-transferase N-terminal domain-containing protein [Loktanella sp.]MDO7664028.1 glutathione S-transferase N-terminal domain-containing protein [Loktanella sp.]MDO7685979.1 glutathione S-transferase N-terminal domain-containing protein [Loktanella sp.]
MIDLYTWTTPNGRKVSILLEELGVPYTAHAIDITKDEQFAPDFLKIAPNNRIPAIVDHDTGIQMMETGAIMMYLADKYGQFQCDGDEYWRMVEWLMWQMGGLGPMLGQTHHFVKYNKGKSAYAEERYSAEALRLYGVLDRRLEGRDYIAGIGRGMYSIADMACWPWVSRFEWQDVDLNAFPNVKDWYLRIAVRPAVQAGYSVPKFTTDVPMP